MIAAIYARKSTDQNVADEEKSVTRQAERARAYAATKGWVVDEAHVYVDDGVSGAEFGKKRPGYIALLNALRPKPAFQVLIVMEQSRLGRSMDEVPYALKRIGDAGVSVYCYLTDSQVKRTTATDKFLVSAMAYVDDMHREQSRQRTRDAMRRKAERGHVAGGKVYGYVNHEITRPGPDGRLLRDHVELRNHPGQAEVVRRIFQETSEGRGLLRIAKGLNADDVPSPRGDGWASTAVREILYRERYRGVMIYGKTRWVDRNDTKVKVDCPRSEWLTVAAPALEIVPEALWRAAHDRVDRTRQTYLRRPGGALWGKPESGINSKYLLTGFLECGTCGKGMQVQPRTSLRGLPRKYYICTTHRRRGDKWCANALSVHMEELEGTVLDVLGRDVLTPDVIEATVARVLSRVTERPDTIAAERASVEADLGRLETELGRYAEAIATAGPLPALLGAIAERESRRQVLQAKLEHLDGLGRAAGAWDRDGMREEVREILGDWRGLLKAEPVKARQVLRKLLAGRLRLTPKIEASGRFYELTGECSYGRLLAGIVGVQALVPPEGFARLAQQPIEILIAA